MASAGVGPKRPAPAPADEPPAQRQAHAQQQQGTASLQHSLIRAATTGGTRTKVLAALFPALADLEEDEADAYRQAALDAALAAAARSNPHAEACEAAIKALAEAGADPNAPDGTGLPALQAFFAGMQQRRSWSEQQVARVLGALITAGSDPAVLTSIGQTALDFAACCPLPAVVRVAVPILLEAGADACTPNGADEPPLFSAASNRCGRAGADAIQQLLHAGADPLAGGSMTALHGLGERDPAAALQADAVAARWQEAQEAQQQEREAARERQEQAEQAAAAAASQHLASALAWHQQRAHDSLTIHHLGRLYDAAAAQSQAAQQQLRAAQQRVRDLEEEADRAASCVVCLHAQRSVVPVGCGHLAMCADCARRCAGVCPVCRQFSSTSLTVRIP
ncbi:hypothetical protein ABPG75_013537 [Micractinium tetrahymenae]